MSGIFKPNHPGPATVAPAGSLSARLQARPRKIYEFDVSAVFGGEPARIAVRVPTKAEQDIAIVGAHDYVAKRAASAQSAANDADLLNDAKSAFIAHVTCRDAQSPDKMPAFLSPQWMIEQFSTDQIGYLVNLANEVRTKESPSPHAIDSDAIEALATLCADHAEDDIPEAVLANLTREYLTHFCVLLSLKLQGARAALVDAMAEPPGDGDGATMEVDNVGPV